jgi:hypothetical protein
MFGKYNGFVSKARVSACMYFLVDSLDTCDGYFEYKLDGTHKIRLQSFYSFDRVRLQSLESVQPFARFNTFDRVCLESIH